MIGSRQVFDGFVRQEFWPLLDLTNQWSRGSAQLNGVATFFKTDRTLQRGMWIFEDRNRGDEMLRELTKDNLSKGCRRGEQLSSRRSGRNNMQQTLIQVQIRALGVPSATQELHTEDGDCSLFWDGNYVQQVRHANAIPPKLGQLPPGCGRAKTEQ